MKVVKEKFGDTLVLVEAIDEPIEIMGGSSQAQAQPHDTQTSAPARRQTEKTGIKEDLEQLYASAKSTIRGIVEEMGKELKSIQAESRPKQVNMEFSIALSAGANL